MVEIVVHDEAGDFIETTGAYLESRECEHNLPLGLVGNLAKDPAYYGPDKAFLVSLMAAGVAIGAAVMTPPRRIILSRIEGRIEGAMAPLVGFLDKVNAPMPGVVGPAEEARAFCAAWQEARPEVEVSLEMELRVFELRQVAPIRLSSGALRAATAADCGLVAEWLFAFGEDIGEPNDIQAVRDSAAKGIAEGAFFFVGQRRAGFDGQMVAAYPPRYYGNGGLHAARISQPGLCVLLRPWADGEVVGGGI